MVSGEKLIKAVLRVLRSLHGKPIDPNAGPDEVADIVESKLKRLKLCKEIAVDFDWDDVDGGLLRVHCDNAVVYAPVVFELRFKTRDLEESDIDVEEAEEEV